MFELQLIFHFLTINVSTHSERIFNWLKNHYHSFDQSDRFGGPAQPYRLEIEECDSPHALPMKLTDATRVKFCLLDDTCSYENGVFASSRHDEYIHTSEADTIGRTVRINVGGDFLRSEEDFIYNVMRDLLKSLVLRVNRLLTLHGAVMVRSGTAILLSGPKGMGKSTISLKLMQSGFAMVSDDSPLITMHEGFACALSSLDELSVTKNTLRLFPELKPLVTRQREISGKYFISRRLLRESQLSYGPAPITLFIDLKRGEYTTANLVERSKQLVLEELFTDDLALFNLPHPVPGYFANINQFQFETFSRLVEQSKTYTLFYSDQHLEQLPQLIEQTVTVAACR